MASLTRAPLPDRDMHTLEEDYAEARHEQAIEETKEELPAQDGHFHIDVPDGRPETSPAGTSYDAHDLNSPGATIATRVQSSVNAPRSREDDKKIWGGKMVDSILAVEGNISLFSDECLSAHGLYDAFYSRNGWGRTIVYLASWLIFGGLFLYLTIPLIDDYNTRVVTTQVDFQEGTTEGLRLPIITACPHGSGVRCHCLLWRKLHCRYAVDVPNEEWQKRFSYYGCIDDFQYEEIPGEPFWVDPQCEDFSNENITLIDPCRATPSEIEDLPFLENATLDAMFDTVVQREDSGDGPYMTYEEVMVYGSQRLTTRLISSQDEALYPIKNPTVFLPNGSGKHIWNQPPASEKQTTPGAQNGITLVVDHLTDDFYTFYDANAATPAFDIHINVVDAERYDDGVLHVERHTYFPVAAGVLTYVEYEVSGRKRKQGWGQRESKDCSKNAIPRSSCVEKAILDRSITECNCSGLNFLTGYVNEDVLSSIAGCSASTGTAQHECIDVSDARGDVSLEECPTQCEATVGEVKSNVQVRLSEKQTKYVRRLLAFGSALQTNFVGVDTTILRNETAIVQVGANSLFKVTFIEDSKVSIGSLLGQIGGNAGLWCGLSFVLMIESLEFVVIALLYGSGFYSGGGKGLKNRVLYMFGSGRRAKTSRS